MSTVNSKSESHNPLIVFVTVVGVALPATVLTWLANSLSKDGPAYTFLPVAVLAVASLIGFGAHLLGLRLDPNVPRLALAPAIWTSFIASGIAFIAAWMWFMR